MRDMAATVRSNILAGKRKWYISDNIFPFKYLHSDGKWRGATLHDGRYTGYFDTRKQAEQCAKKAGIEL